MKENRQLQEALFEMLDGSYWLDSERYFACYCPFDTHHTRALLVYPDGAHCQSCNQSYSLDYLEKNVSLTPTRPVIAKSTVLPRWKGWENKYGDIAGIAEAGHKFLTPERQGGHRKRKIDQFITKGMFGMLDGWWTFPVMDKHHTVVDIVVRNGGRKDKDVKYVLKPYDVKTVRPLYCPDWDLVLKNRKIVVCYGILDVWAFYAVGLPSVTGITGKSLNANLFETFPDKEFIIIPDEGEEREAYRLAGQLGWRGSVLRVNWPYGIKDPDDYRRNLTEVEWKRLTHGEWKIGEQNEM